MLLNWENLPTEYDTPFHLLISKMFADYDSIVLWDVYEYQPYGRPNLYPPLEHIMIWFIHDLTGLRYLDLARLISSLQYILSLTAVFFLSTKFFGSLSAIASMIFLSASMEFFWWQTSVAPSSLILSIYPLFLYCFYKKNLKLCVLMLTGFLYLHLGFPYLIICGILIFGVLSLIYEENYLKETFIVVSLSLLLFSPWAFHVFGNLEYFQGEKKDSPASLLMFISNTNLLQVLFLTIGLFFCMKWILRDAKYLLLISNFLAFSTILLIYPQRYNIHSPIINSVIAGFGFSSSLNFHLKHRREIKTLFTLYLLAFSCFSEPQLIGFPQKKGILSSKVPPFSNLFQGFVNRSPLIDKSPMIQSFFTEKETYLLLDWICENTKRDEIIHLENGALAAFITLQTDRRTNYGMWWEVLSEEKLRGISTEKDGIYVFQEDAFLDLKGCEIEILERIGKYTIAKLSCKI